VRRNAILGVLFAGEIFALLLSLLFYMKTRVAVLDAYREYGTVMPRGAQVALSSWFLPGAMGTALLLSALAIGLPLRVVICSAALVYAVWSAFAPLFELA
jgi:hypothetical protein